MSSKPTLYFDDNGKYPYTNCSADEKSLCTAYGATSCLTTTKLLNTTQEECERAHGTWVSQWGSPLREYRRAFGTDNTGIHVCGGIPICKWENESEQTCPSPGIWTSADSGFAKDHRGLDNTCITQLVNLCKLEHINTCNAKGATCRLTKKTGWDEGETNDKEGQCERALGDWNGEKSICENIPICEWNANNATACPSPGLWTAADSGYANNHEGVDDTCITQLANL